VLDEDAAGAIRAAVGHDWSVFDVLASHDESSLRRILRSHREVGFTSEDVNFIRLRRVLDDALDRLTLIELGIEAGILDETALPVVGSLRDVLQSSAFGRYLDSYLYFGVRFIASRVLGPVGMSLSGHSENDDLPVALPYPTALLPEHATGASEAVQRWLNLRSETAATDDVASALDFLDDVVTIPGEPAQYELWLQGLSSYPEDDPHFQSLTRGLLEFAQSKAGFYVNLEGEASLTAWREVDFARGVWTAKQPITARFGVLDLYWLARLLRADISPAGIVSYGGNSWLARLATREPEGSQLAQTLDQTEEILRAVFFFTCDLVQNAADIAGDSLDRRSSPNDFPQWPSETVNWRAAYDEEIHEIVRQRAERTLGGNVGFESSRQSQQSTGERVGWSWRVRTGEHLEDLVGLALSSGGIRSATFGLGVLQRLQKLDLLRSVDYLSMVSGGGFIGAWLVGNVHRTQYWVNHATDWGRSIEHLRRFSSYLAPRSGLMSTDTWTMWGNWVLGALWIQLGIATWLALLLVFIRVAKSLFDFAVLAPLATFPGILALAPALVMLAATLVRNLRRESQSSHEEHVLLFGMLPAWSLSFLTAAGLWADRAAARTEYFEILISAWQPWFWPLVLIFVFFWIVSWLSVNTSGVRVLLGAFPAGAATGLAYMGLCAIFWWFGQLSGDPDRYSWYAYVVGPPLVFLVGALTLITVAWLIGRDLPESRRVWLMRFGSWPVIYSAGYLVLGVVSVFGPSITLWLFDRSWGSLPWRSVEWSAVLGWVGAAIGSLFAGSSEQSAKRDDGTLLNKAIDWVTNAAVLVFVVGGMLITSTGVHGLLARFAAPGESQTYWTTLNAISPRNYWLPFEILLILALVISWRFDLNSFGLNESYRNRLVRCFLGATRWRSGVRRPNKFTGFDAQDDLQMSVLRHHSVLDAPDRPYSGPFPIVNCSLSLGSSSDLGVLSRPTASFVFTPLRAGADRKNVGYAPSDGSSASFAGGLPLGQAISISGASIGYYSSRLSSILLTMFNAGVAWWLPNPGRKYWSSRWLRFSQWYLVKEMFGLVDERNLYVSVSDGSHFEGLGIYELVRRRCKVIIACDAEYDPMLAFGSLGNVIRMCETDFNAKIDIDLESIRKPKDSDVSRAHCAVGKITYSNGSVGYLIYLKASLSGDEESSIAQYVSSHSTFPHESTTNRFAEDQFESYRRLGYHVASMTFRDVAAELTLVAMGRKLVDLWTPVSVGSDLFVEQAEEIDAISERIRTSPSLHRLMHELTANRQVPLEGEPTEEELFMCVELFRRMEIMFVKLRLDDLWAHPDLRGWVALFRTWAKSATFRIAWQRSRGLFGVRFVHFCHRRLGL
jgi:hypothetical protein